MITRDDLRKLFINSCDMVLLEDQEYPTCSKSYVKDLLRDFHVAPYIPEIADCDNRADRMRFYLIKNGIKPGYIKLINHLALILLSDKNELFIIDPGTKRIEKLKFAQYVAWWV